MKNSKKVFLFLTVVSLLAVLLAVGVLSAEEGAPRPAIYAANLSFEDSVYLMYAVDTEGLPAEQVKMLFWTAPILEGDADAYVKGTEAYESSAYGDVNIGGKTYQTFKYDKLRAKNMTDVIYARAYVEVDGEIYYSDVSKYSILQYAYNKLGYTGTATTNAKLYTMLNNMLNYGASAQRYFKYNTDRLATNSFYRIKLEGGVLADGCTHGLYLAGEVLNVTAPTTNGEGNAFLGWMNTASGTMAALHPKDTITVGKANANYCASYVAGSEGLVFADNGDGTYSVSDMGTCTDTTVMIPATHLGKPVTAIAAGAFAGSDDLSAVMLPASIVTIGENAFDMCPNFRSVYFAGTAEEWAEVTVADSGSCFTHAAVYYFSAEQPTVSGEFWHYEGGTPVVWPRVYEDDLADIEDLDEEIAELF